MVMKVTFRDALRLTDYNLWKHHKLKIINLKDFETVDGKGYGFIIYLLITYYVMRGIQATK